MQYLESQSVSSLNGKYSNRPNPGNESKLRLQVGRSGQYSLVFRKLLLMNLSSSVVLESEYRNWQVIVVWPSTGLRTDALHFGSWRSLTNVIPLSGLSTGNQGIIVERALLQSTLGQYLRAMEISDDIAFCMWNLISIRVTVLARRSAMIIFIEEGLPCEKVTISKRWVSCKCKILNGIWILSFHERRTREC